MSKYGHATVTCNSEQTEYSSSGMAWVGMAHQHFLRLLQSIPSPMS